MIKSSVTREAAIQILVEAARKHFKAHPGELNMITSDELIKELKEFGVMDEVSYEAMMKHVELFGSKEAQEEWSKTMEGRIMDGPSKDPNIREGTGVWEQLNEEKKPIYNPLKPLNQKSIDLANEKLNPEDFIHKKEDKNDR